MTFPASFSPLAGGKASGFSDTSGGSDPFALPGSKAAGPGSPAMATAASPLVAQAAAPAGQLLGSAAIEALGRLGLGDLVRMVGPGSGYIAGGLTALLSELAFPQRTANADDMATLMRALAAEGVTFDGHVAWETLPDGRPMMVLADDPDTIIAILQEGNTVVINSAVLPNAGRAGDGAGVTPETLMQYGFGDAPPSWTGKVVLTIADLPEYERGVPREERTQFSAFTQLYEAMRAFNAGATLDDEIQLHLIVRRADGTPVTIILQGLPGDMRAEVEALIESGLIEAEYSVETFLRTAAAFDRFSRDVFAAIVSGRSVIPGPLDGPPAELPQAGPQGNPSFPPVPGFPANDPGMPPYTDTSNNDPSVPTTEAGPQTLPDPREFDPNRPSTPLYGPENALPGGSPPDRNTNEARESDEAEGADEAEGGREGIRDMAEYAALRASLPDVIEEVRAAANNARPVMTMGDKLNVAKVEYDLDGVTGYLYGASGNRLIQNFVPPVAEGEEVIPARYNNRTSDTEYKLLNWLARNLNEHLDGAETSGRIVLFSQYTVCDSCANVIREFKRMFPLIDIIVIAGERQRPQSLSDPLPAAGSELQGE
ncbi:MAG: deaminase domain-containing protein [Salinarimonas sp.]